MAGKITAAERACSGLRANFLNELRGLFEATLNGNIGAMIASGASSIQYTAVGSITGTAMLENVTMLRLSLLLFQELDQSAELVALPCFL